MGDTNGGSDGQAESAAPGVMRARVLRAPEAIEHPLEMFGIDAGSAI